MPPGPPDCACTFVDIGLNDGGSLIGPRSWPALLLSGFGPAAQDRLPQTERRMQALAQCVVNTTDK
eukprot:349194-Prymnesium_polylepis.1